MGDSSPTRPLFVPRSFTPHGLLPVAHPRSPHTDDRILAEQEPGPGLFSHAVNIFKIEKQKEKKKRKEEKRKQTKCLFQIGLEQE